MTAKVLPLHLRPGRGGPKKVFIWSSDYTRRATRSCPWFTAAVFQVWTAASWRMVELPDSRGGPRR